VSDGAFGSTVSTVTVNVFVSLDCRRFRDWRGIAGLAHADGDRLEVGGGDLIRRLVRVAGTCRAAGARGPRSHDLGISERTTKIHRRQVLEKMEGDSIAHPVRMASDLGITPAGKVR
jgi:hypothetical protein